MDFQSCEVNCDPLSDDFQLVCRTEQSNGIQESDTTNCSGIGVGNSFRINNREYMNVCPNSYAPLHLDLVVISFLAIQTDGWDRPCTS